ncbi:hypothetical protein ACI6Q2_08445 [Chitinophagaceae bacterium LWZ2-11]
MLLGTFTHVRWIINNGFLSERYDAPFLSKLFWDSLTFLDPIAATLLIIKPKIGIGLTAIIIIVDVFHNGFYCFSVFPVKTMYVISWIKDNWMLMTQIAFGLFVVVTFKNNKREIKVKTNTLV